MKTVFMMLFTLLLASPTVVAQTSSKTNPPTGSAPTPKSSANPSATSASKASPVPAPSALPADSSLGSKTIHYSERDVVKLKTKVRFTTLIILPENEKILDFSCGDADWWRVEGAENFAYVKPAKAAALTNLNLITASGNIYSFSLAEISDIPNAEPDLKVFVELQDESMLAAAKGVQRFVSAAEIERYRREAEAAKAETIRVKQITDETIEKGVDKILSKVRCAYEFKKNKKPFYVSTICHDGKFTYLSMAAEETPTLYDLREGENLVNFSFKPIAPLSLSEDRPNSGILTVQKVIQRGYLAIGKERLHFSIEE